MFGSNFLPRLFPVGMLLLMFAVALPACTNPRGGPKEPVRVSKPAPAPKKLQDKAGDPSDANNQVGDRFQPAAPVGQKPPPDPCRVLTTATGMPPFFVPPAGVMITRFLKECVTRTGQRGFQQDSPYMTMGFPCTAGSGRIELKGSSYIIPKMISLSMGTECPMAPANKAAVHGSMRSALKLPEKSQLVAHTPFVIQYWEVPGLPDADTGFTVHLRSIAAREGVWSRLRNQETLRIKLFGRENSWVGGEQFYEVDVDVKLTGTHQFISTIAGARPLPADEVKQVEARCQALRPRRNCNQAF